MIEAINLGFGYTIGALGAVGIILILLGLYDWLSGFILSVRMFWRIKKGPTL